MPGDNPLVPRTRLLRLMEDIESHSLVLLEAPTGYGKTTLVHQLTQNWGEVAWVALRPGHKDPAAFWACLIQQLDQAAPHFASVCREVGLPETQEQVEQLAQKANTGWKGVHPLLVLDDYSMIVGARTDDFIKQFFEISLKGFTVVVCSSVETKLGYACLSHGGSVLSLSADDLAFTRKETAAYFATGDIVLSEYMNSVIHRRVGGWPLAVVLMARQLRGKVLSGEEDRFIDGGLKASGSLLAEILENEGFAHYPEAVRDTLTRLSLFESFRLDMAVALAGGSSREMERALTENMFVHHTLVSGRYSFFPHYRHFLAEKLALMDTALKEDFVGGACIWLENRGLAVEAMAHSFDNGMFPLFLRLIKDHPEAFASYTESDGIMDRIGALPQDVINSLPQAKYLAAVVKLDREETPAAEAMLYELREMLETQTGCEQNELLGEVYIALAEISKMHNNPDFPALYTAAMRHLPNGSRYRLLGRFYYREIGIYTDSTEAGALERMKRVMLDALPRMNVLFGGMYTGYEALVHADHAFYTGDFEGACSYGNEAVMEGEKRGLKELSGLGRFCVARSTFMRGSLEGIYGQIRALEQEINRDFDPVSLGQKECLQMWLYVLMGDLEKVKRWLGSAQNYKTVQHWWPMKLVYAHYLLETGDVDQHVSFTNQNEVHNDLYGGFIGKVYISIGKAVTALRRGDKVYAMDMLWQAYMLTYNIGVITPYIELGADMRALLDVARRDDRHAFDESWVSMLYTKCMTYYKRMRNMRILYAKENNLPAEDASKLLSKMERTILYELTQGFSREELSIHHGISSSTVGTHIKNIYNKLGVFNSAEAVHMAHLLGIIKA